MSNKLLQLLIVSQFRQTYMANVHVCFITCRSISMTSIKPNSSSTFGKGISGNSSSPDSINQQKQYIFTPAGLDVKLILSVIFVIVNVVGFVGNLCVLRFISKEEKKKKVTNKSSNLNFFIRSLAISDVLGALVGTPLFVIQFYFDVFQSAWPCKIYRFFQFLFLVITIYNLLVVALERYILICHPTSRPLSLASVKKAVKGAWLFGFLVTLLPASTYEGLRIDLNDTHYTFFCTRDNSNPLTIVTAHIAIVIVYVLPSLFLAFTSISIIRVIRKRKIHVPVIQPAVSLALRKLRFKKKKATTLLVAIIMAFIIPYLMVFVYLVFKTVFKPSIDFTVDYVLVQTSVLLAYLNSSVNFLIHLIQLPGFRSSLKSGICCGKYQSNIALHVSVHKRRSRDGNQSITPSNKNHCNVRRASMSDVQQIKSSHKVGVRKHSV